MNLLQLFRPELLRPFFEESNKTTLNGDLPGDDSLTLWLDPDETGNSIILCDLAASLACGVRLSNSMAGLMDSPPRRKGLGIARSVTANGWLMGP